MDSRGPTRRRFSAGLITVLVVGGTSASAAAAVAVEVPNTAIGAIVSAVGGSLVEISVDASLAPASIRVGDGAPVDVGARVLLKGKGAARHRFLDDARNAPKVGANIRKVLSAADGANAKRYEDNHRAWSRPFARKVLRWQQQLAKAKLAGKRIRDAHGRIYLLEWAGAKIDPKAKSSGPAALAKLPDGPRASTPGAYETYVTKLVTAVGR